MCSFISRIVFSKMVEKHLKWQLILLRNTILTCFAIVFVHMYYNIQSGGKKQDRIG